jgi:elongator complex protein 2
LTVTRLRFSADDHFLLSVGRDRQWAVFQRVGEGKAEYKLLEQNLKGHSRMILDAAWAPGEGKVFATAGREKTVKVWARDETGFTCRTTITEDHPVTAVDFMDALMGDGKAYLAVGTEVGRLRIYAVDVKGDHSATEVEVAYSKYVHLLNSKSSIH